MPYITQERRNQLEPYGYDGSFPSVPETPGELNYMITSYCRSYMLHKKLSYQTINDIVGALECAKQEFLRRVVAPYEDEAIKRNGDLY